MENVLGGSLQNSWPFFSIKDLLSRSFSHNPNQIWHVHAVLQDKCPNIYSWFLIKISFLYFLAVISLHWSWSFHTFATVKIYNVYPKIERTFSDVFLRVIVACSQPFINLTLSLLENCRKEYLSLESHYEFGAQASKQDKTKRMF